MRGEFLGQSLEGILGKLRRSLELRDGESSLKKSYLDFLLAQQFNQ